MASHERCVVMRGTHFQKQANERGENGPQSAERAREKKVKRRSGEGNLVEDVPTQIYIESTNSVF